MRCSSRELLNVRYLTGFTGSNGQLLVTADGATFLTDGRYTEQARHEVARPRRDVTYRRTYRDALPRRCVATAVTRLGFEAPTVTVARSREARRRAGGRRARAARRARSSGAARVKDAEELELLRRAQAATDGAFDGSSIRCASG